MTDQTDLRPEDGLNGDISEEILMNEQMRIRMAKLDELKAAGEDPYVHVTFDTDTFSSDITGDFESMDGRTVSVAGRIMSKRGMGKVSFCDLQDSQGKIQLFTKIDKLGEDAYAKWQKLDIDRKSVV